MPITGTGFEIHVVRFRVDKRASDGKRRIVGRYRVYHDGVAQNLEGMMCETRGPGDNSHEDNNRCIEAGRYPLETQAGVKFVTIGYRVTTSPSVLPKPGILVGNTNKRTGILIHPGYQFLSSIGCLNPTKALAGAGDMMDYVDSRDRVIALITDLKAYAGARFPTKNGKRIPDAFLVVEEQF